MTRQTPIIITESSQKSGTPWYLAILAAIGVGGAYMYNRSRADNNQNNQAAQLQTDVFTQQAAIIHNAIAGLGTDTKALFDVAPKITDWVKVSAAYTALTKGANIEDDLSGDLDAQEYKYFMSLIQVKGRSQVQGKGLVKAITAASIGLVANKLIKLKPKADSGELRIYASIADYAKGNVAFKLPVGKVLIPSVQAVKFRQAHEYQYSTDVYTGVKKDVVLGPKINLYEFQWTGGTGIFKDKIYFTPDYNFVNKGK